MKLLLASSEVFPFSKTGGLADMVGALARALARSGHEVRIVTPLYRGLQKKFPAIKPVDWSFRLALGHDTVDGTLWELDESNRLKIYFVGQDHFFDRPGIYNEKNVSYPDNADRFLFFSKCAVHLARYLHWKADVLHVHDWQTGLVPALVLNQKSEGWNDPPATCLTIHNLAYQGVFPKSAFSLSNLPEHFFTPSGCEFYGSMNFLKAAIAFSDAITTVSPTYAHEITTEEFGCGLDGMLRQREEDLHGILNGVDYEEWNTTKNPHLFKPYSASRMSGKLACKLDLQKLAKLSPSASTPLFGTISRLAEQKGVEIQLAALTEMLNTNMQFILLGSGSPEYERAYKDLARRFPGKASVIFGYDESLSHRIESGCDFFLMPSRFEPCGLNQMYSLRYGTIPIVRATGGLDDSIIDWGQNPTIANGIKFTGYNARALVKAIRKALVLYSHPELFENCRKNGMKADFSWNTTVHSYIDIYRKIIGRLKAVE